MNNADKFKQVFGIYASELWSMPKEEFWDWISADASPIKAIEDIKTEIDEQYDRVHPYDISCAEGLEMALNIVDKYIAEEGKA